MNNKFPRRVNLENNIGVRKKTNTGDIDLGSWIQHALDNNWITGAGGGGSIPNPMTAPITIDQDSNKILFDDGEFEVAKTLVSGYNTGATLGSENILEVGIKGSSMLTFDTVNLVGGAAIFGDLQSIGLTSNPTGFIVGTVDFSGNLGAFNFRGDVDVTDGTTTGIVSANTQGTATGDVSLDIIAQISGASGNSVLNINSIAFDQATLTLDSNVIKTATAATTRLKAKNTTDNVGVHIKLVSDEGIHFQDQAETNLITWTEAFNSAQYADDTAASGGGVAIGEAYVRTGGELAIRLT